MQPWSECNIALMSEKYMYLKIVLLPLQQMSFFLRDEHYLKFHFCVCTSLCTDGIGLSSSKGNVMTFCYTLEIHEFLVKIKGVTWRFFIVATVSTNQSAIMSSFLE